MYTYYSSFKSSISRNTHTDVCRSITLKNIHTYIYTYTCIHKLVALNYANFPVHRLRWEGRINIIMSSASKHNRIVLFIQKFHFTVNNCASPATTKQISRIYNQFSMDSIQPWNGIKLEIVQSVESSLVIDILEDDHISRKLFSENFLHKASTYFNSIPFDRHTNRQIVDYYYYYY